eukprot:scpid77928/ scgid5495/ 
MADNPFDLPDFVCKIQLWLNLVDADRLRNAVIKKRLLTDSSVIERLRRTLRLHGPTAHNEELVQLLRAGGLAAYRELSDAVKELGYSTKSVEMLSVLPEQHAPEDTAQAMVLAVSPRPTSSTPVLAETQPTSSPPVRETQPPANDEHVHAEHAPPESTADVPSGNRSLTLSTPDVPAEPAGETRRAAHGIPARLLLLSLLAGVIGTLVMLSSTAGKASMPHHHCYVSVQVPLSSCYVLPILSTVVFHSYFRAGYVDILKRQLNAANTCTIIVAREPQ